MDRSANQVLRWGMAGWCLMVELGGFFALYKIILAGDKPFTLVQGRIPVLADPGLMTVVFAAIGVPLGYFIYQLYYFLFWTVPLSKEDPPERPLIERLIERCSRSKQLDKELQGLYDAWANVVCRGRFSRKGDKLWVRFAAWPFAGGKRTPREVMGFRSRWALSRSAWLHALSQGGADHVGTALAGERFEYLTSMFDGLGAIMVANWLAFVTAFAYNLWRILYIDGSGQLQFHLAWTTLRAPATAVMLVFTALEFVACYAFHRIIWTNRVYLRMSVVTLADAFICQFGCDDRGCLDQGERPDEDNDDRR